MKYAGFWIRVCASLIDYLIFYLAAVILVVAAAVAMAAVGSGYPDESRLTGALSYIGSFIGSWLYWASFESGRWQATPGKRIVGLRVTDLEGHRITFGRASGRHFSKILSAIILGIGYILVGTSDKKQGLHDTIADTLVLYGKAGQVEPHLMAIGSTFSLQENTVLEPLSSARNSSSWVMAGVNTNGHVVRVKFEHDDPKLDQGGLVIGRDAQACDVHISDQSISRRHARVFKKNGEIWLEDLSSTNGTIVNGRAVARGGSVALSDQGNITLGGVELSVGRY